MTRRPLPVPAAPSSSSDRDGFVLGLVVLFLFAIAVGATAGYQMVNAEFTLSQGARDGQQALVVARAGLERFLADQIGEVGDSVRYRIGMGEALVTSRLVYQEDSDNHLYYIESEGSVMDARMPDDPARRTVGTYAWHRIAPFPHVAALFITEGSFRVQGSSTQVVGYDASSSTDCPGGGTSGVYGVATGGSASTKDKGYYAGNPSAEDESYTGYDDVYAAMQVRWDVLSDPAFPVDLTEPADWGSLPSDSFPVGRTTGDPNAWTGGRGLLIIPDAWTPGPGFTWDGIIMAGQLSGNSSGDSNIITGMVFAGLDGLQPDADLNEGVFQYDYCKARAANESGSYLERIDNAVYEVN